MRYRIAALLLGLSALAGCKGAEELAAPPVPSAQEVRAALDQVVASAKAKVDAEFDSRPMPAARIVVPPADDAGKIFFSFATFDYDNLDGCLDFAIAPHAGGRADDAKATAEGIAQSYTRSRLSLAQVPKPCAEQFAGRTVHATCDVQMTDARTQLVGRFRYYHGYAVEQKDVHMRDCLQMGGHWQLAKAPTAAIAR